MNPLLNIETESVRFELRGPQSDPTALGTHSARMRIEVFDGALERISWLDASGSEHSDASRAGPALYEWTTYEIFAESRNGLAVELRHRDPRLLANVASPQRRPDLVSGRLSFRGQIGLTRLEVWVAGRAAVRIELEVFPTKLDYESDYDALVAEVNSATRALALEYLRATYQGGSEEYTSRPRDVEFATLLRHHADDLDRAMQWVSAHPARQLLRFPVFERIERIRRPTHLTKKAIRQGRGQGPLVQVPTVGPVRRMIPSVRATETLDTPEHKWLRMAVSRVKRRVHSLLDTVTAELARAEAQGRATARLVAERDELSSIGARLARILAVEPLSEALGSAPQGFSSLRLLRTPGYREAVRALLALNRGLTLDGGAIETSVKDIEVLYEYWCFLRLTAWLYEIAGFKADFSDLFHQAADGLRTRLAPGSEVEVTITGGFTLRLAYNRSFRGLTGSQRPDLLLTLESQGWPSVFVVIDAKYRVQADPEYLHQFKLPGPPIDAINQLHRYRDAIVLKDTDSQRNRPVVRGAALFPLDAGRSAGWHKAPLRRALDLYGIGALPFLPGNEDLGKSWLVDVLAEPTSQLAIPGPAFAAAAELRRVELLANRTVLLVAASAPEVGRCVNEGRVHVPGLPPPTVVVDAVALLTTGPTGDSVVRVVADVRAIDLNGGTTVLHTDTPQTPGRTLTDSINATLPAVTSAIALDRSTDAGELGLGSIQEWDLVELLNRRAIRYDATASNDSSGRLRSRISVGSASAIWERDKGFLIQTTGGELMTRRLPLDAVAALCR
jgi:hypothetical protein